MQVELCKRENARNEDRDLRYSKLRLLQSAAAGKKGKADFVMQSYYLEHSNEIVLIFNGMTVFLVSKSQFSKSKDLSF